MGQDDGRRRLDVGKLTGRYGSPIDKGKYRRCPACKAPMKPVEAHGVTGDVCVRCKGLWLDEGELAPAIGRKIDDEVQTAAIAGARRTKRQCPECRTPLYEHALLPGARLLVDECTECRGVFLERGEYSRAKALVRGSREGETPQFIDDDRADMLLFQYLTRLPLELGTPQRLFSPVVTTLIGLNVAVLAVAMALGFWDTLLDLALVPDEICHGQRLYTLLTHMFMHGGILHLVGNMYFLFVTGDNVEEDLGWRWFAVFYLASGLVAAAAHIAGDPDSLTPCIGASGAISGVMGAYVVLFPQNRFLLRFFYFALMHVRLELPAWAFFGFWILLQVLYAAMDISGVAWYAHIGGFACGVAVALGVRAVRARRSA